MYSLFAGLTVMVFILRLLKSLHFQERMGLVTRILAEAWVDLFHFIILFLLVFVGYACVGYVLFGHQSQAFSNLSDSCMTLFFILVSFDATMFLQEWSHSSMEFAVHIYLWSYLIIVMFILLNNIFLAIIVAAYTKVKEDSDGMSIFGMSIAVMHDAVI